MSETRKILITGGLGYIGSRLAKDLTQLGNYEVILTTRKSPELWPELNLTNVRLVQSDLMDREQLLDHLSGVETIFHLAGPNEKQVVERPSEAIDGSLKASLNLLNASVRSKIENFFFFSTIHVYGSPLVGHIDENTCPKPRHPYGILNRAVEDYVLMYREISDLNAVVFRLSNAYGSPVYKDIDRWSLVVNDLCRMAVEKSKIVLHSNGSQLRDFFPISDLSEILHQFFLNKKFDTKYGIYNFGKGQSVSILQLAKKIQEIHKNKYSNFLLIEKGQDKILNPPPFIFDNSRLLSTGASFRSLDSEIEETLEFCYKMFT